ncbi:MAG: oligosaccharide flippase family protein, partial [Candidatus Rokuibacteriota bacterium]
MDPLRSILRNSSLLIAAQAVAIVIGMTVVVLLPRFLGDAEFGRLHLALSLAMMFGILVEFGLAQVLARAVARERALARPYVRAAVPVYVGLAAVGYLALLAAVRLLGYPARVRDLVTILGIVTVAEALSQILGALFQAHERMLIPALARIAGNAFTLAAVTPLLTHGYGASAVAVVLALSVVLRVAIQAAGLPRLDGYRRRDPGTTASWRGLAVAGVPFVIWQGLGILYFRMDVLMLGRLATDATIGWYGAATRLMDALNFVPQLVTMAAFPVVARLWVSSPAQFRDTVRKTLHLLLAVTAPVTAGLITLAPEIVDLLFTLEGFGPSVPILRIHALTLGLLFVDYLLVGVIMAVGRERRWIAIAGAACLLSPALHLLLIPATATRLGNGGVGAAVGTCLVEVFIMTSALRLLPAGTLGRE